MKWTRWGIENNILEEVYSLWNSTLYSEALFFRIASCCFFVHLDSPRKNSYVPCAGRRLRRLAFQFRSVFTGVNESTEIWSSRETIVESHAGWYTCCFSMEFSFFIALWLSSAGWGFGFGWYNPPKTQHRDSWFSPFWHSFREWVFVQRIMSIRFFFWVLM